MGAERRSILGGRRSGPPILAEGTLGADMGGPGGPRELPKPIVFLLGGGITPSACPSMVLRP